MSGVVGHGVTGVTFVLQDGTHVQATVRDGWYLAWWPGSAKLDATDPVAIKVTTSAGTEPTRYSSSYLRRYYHPCLLDERCTGPKMPKLVQGVALALTRHFALFRNTPPASDQQLAALDRAMPMLLSGGIMGTAQSRLGVDEAQMRVVSFGSLGTMLITPGTAGICLTVVSVNLAAHGGGGSAEGNGASGGCDSLKHFLAHGTFMFANLAGVNVDAGIVADGNPHRHLPLRLRPYPDRAGQGQRGPRPPERNPEVGHIYKRQGKPGTLAQLNHMSVGENGGKVRGKVVRWHVRPA